MDEGYFEYKRYMEKEAFLRKHLRMFIEYNSYLILHYGILYWHLDSIAVLQSVLSSLTIREDKDPIERSASGAKVYFELYQYLRLVKSEFVKNWLINSFPKMEERFQNAGNYLSLRCIDSFNMEVKEEEIQEYASLGLMMQKH